MMRQVIEVKPILEDARRRFGFDNTYPLSGLEYWAWHQTWANTACGFRRVAGQAITVATTIIVRSFSYPTVVVYHAGEFAYEISRPNEEFWNKVRGWKLPGASDEKRWKKLDGYDPEADLY